MVCSRSHSPCPRKITKLLGYESQRLSNCENCTYSGREEWHPEASTGWASSPVGVGRLTLGTDLSPAGETDTGALQTAMPKIVGSIRNVTNRTQGHPNSWTVNAGWQSPWGQLARGGPQLMGEEKGRNQQ